MRTPMRTKTGKLIPTIIGAALLVTGSTSLALAQPPIEDYEMEEEREREGLTFGVGISAGHLELAVGACPGGECTGFTSAGGLNASVGLMLTPTLAIEGSVWSMGHLEEDLFVSHTIATVGPKLWFGDRLWVKAAAGASRAAFNYDPGVVDFSDSTGYVLAATASTGFEIISTEDFALDVQLQGGSGFFGTADTRVRNLAIGLGATWY